MPELPMTMPKMSMTMEEGTMVSWLKSVGDTVRSGEPICEVATDKVDIEVECPFDGVLARIVAEVDEVVPVGETIAVITTDADDLLGGLFDEPGDPTSAVPDAEAPEVAVVGSASSVSAHSGPTMTRAVPLARSLAADHGIDLRTITPTGPWHTIRVSDVEAVTSFFFNVTANTEIYTATHTAPETVPQTHGTPLTHAAPASAPDAAEARRLRGRQQLAKVMSASAQVPQFTAFADLDLRAAQAIRKTALEGASWTVLLVRAQAIALTRVAALNATWIDDRARPNAGVGVALAVDSPNGLIAPVVSDPQVGSLTELSARIRDSIEGARAGTLGLDRITGGTTVFSNLGGLGVDSFNALLTPPQATALSAGAVAQRVYATESGAIAVGLRCTIGITVDHRVADGADAARFLTVMRELFADPEQLR